MRVKYWEFLLRLVYFMFGLMMFALGIAITIVADIGVSPWDATSVGLYTLFGLSIGTWMNVQSVLLILMGACIAREFPKITCMITSFIMSAFVDLFVYVLQGIVIEVWIVKLMVYALGVIIVSIGCGTYLIAEFPPNPIDCFMMSIKKGLHVSIAKAMTICEGSGFLFAFLVQGPIGLGTILAVIIYGPMIEFFNKQAHRVYARLKRHLPQVVHNAVDI